ncbi:calponin homology domain-containing protein DDB_G0272472 isoform X1 [Cucurbita maxima]|uniref:Calponin homology domain-containing protein DDB_G0272472 isoform X1 n=1 Tax=Cucurbita maxima TaxID=3661 RepID=A0A6J1JI67_CUCMA|nr:calponin homology domain-containing protein DDB_G0272472 isoform X1 [Cucurbita maxima]
MSSLATVTATRRPKWQYPQPAPPTPRILHFPRRPRTRRRPSKSVPAKPSSGFDGRGKLEALFDQERAFLKDGFPVVLMDRGEGRSERVEEREIVGVASAAAEEKWRFQAEMLRAECNLLRMEREITNKKLEKMKVRMERTLKSAVQALVSGKNKVYEGKDMEMVLEDEINDLAKKLERLRRGSRNKQIVVRKCSNFDKRASLLQRKLEKIDGNSGELIATETKDACGDHESFISSGKFNNVQVEVLRRKMEDLSKGTLLEKMREECRSMLSITATSSVVSSATSSAASSKIRTEHPDSSMPTHLPNLDSTSQERNQCSGHCKAIIRRITEQVKAEKDQWSQMQEMLNQVREEMEELQVSREFWKDQALESESQIRSLQSSVEEWKHKVIAHESKTKEVERSKKKGQGRHGQASPPDEMEKHVLICRVKEKNPNLLHARDVRSRRREISIDEQQLQQQQQQKIHSHIKAFEKSQRLPFRDITNNYLHK